LSSDEAVRALFGAHHDFAVARPVPFPFFLRSSMFFSVCPARYLLSKDLRLFFFTAAAQYFFPYEPPVLFLDVDLNGHLFSESILTPSIFPRRGVLLASLSGRQFSPSYEMTGFASFLSEGPILDLFFSPPPKDTAHVAIRLCIASLRQVRLPSDMSLGETVPPLAHRSAEYEVPPGFVPAFALEIYLPL